MNEAIIERHNSVVQPDDLVFALGDCCLGGGDAEMLQKNKELIERLNGQIIIIRGNHDTNQRVDMYATCKNVVDSGKYADMVKYKRYHFYLSHFPTLTGNLEKESLEQCTLNLYGHTHQLDDFYEDRPYMFHIGCDSTNCYPISIDDIIVKMKEKVEECKEQL